MSYDDGSGDFDESGLLGQSDVDAAIYDSLMGGGEKRGRGSRYLDPLDTRSSGRTTFTAAELNALTGLVFSPWRQLMSAQRPPGEKGLASIYVTEYRASGLADTAGGVVTGNDGPDGTRTVVPELLVTWSDGFATGEANVDVTQGKAFTVAGVQSIELKVRVRSAVDGVNLTTNTERAMTYEAVVQWSGSISPKSVYWTSRRVTVTANVFSGNLEVPKHASHVMVLPTVHPATLSLRMKRGTASPGAGIATICEVQDAFMSSIPVVAGARYVQISSSVDNDLTTVWELNL